MKIERTKIVASICSLLFVGCSSAQIKDYANTTPQFELEDFFNGPMVAKGVFQKRGGMVSRKFVIEMEGKWEGAQGTLEEHFVYDDGEKHYRKWIITKNGDGTYKGTADDIVGEAYGEIQGFALRWKYVMALKVDNKIYHVNFDDWMYAIDDKTIINRSFMSKFGYELGQVTLSIEKK